MGVHIQFFPGNKLLSVNMVLSLPLFAKQTFQNGSKWTMQLCAEKWESWHTGAGAMDRVLSEESPFLASHLGPIYSSGCLIIGVTSGHRRLGLFCFHEMIS